MAFKLEPMWVIVALLAYAIFFSKKSGYGGIEYDNYISFSRSQERTGPQASVNFTPGSFGDDEEED